MQGQLVILWSSNWREVLPYPRHLLSLSLTTQKAQLASDYLTRWPYHQWTGQKVTCSLHTQILTYFRIARSSMLFHSCHIFGAISLIRSYSSAETCNFISLVLLFYYSVGAWCWVKSRYGLVVCKIENWNKCYKERLLVIFTRSTKGWMEETNWANHRMLE